MARVQRLSETPRPDGGYPLSTYVEAYLIGDMTAIAAAAIRSEGLLKR
jgi:ribosomal protein L21E